MLNPLGSSPGVSALTQSKFSQIKMREKRLSKETVSCKITLLNRSNPVEQAALIHRLTPVQDFRRKDGDLRIKGIEQIKITEVRPPG